MGAGLAKDGDCGARVTAVRPAPADGKNGRWRAAELVPNDQAEITVRHPAAQLMVPRNG
jgi:hypothetical protein